MPGFPSLPATVWRAETGRIHPPGRSVADVLRFEAANGSRLDLDAEAVADFERADAAALFWVCFSREAAARYGDPQEIALNDAPAVILATDHKGGFLLLLLPADDDEDDDMSADDPTDRAIDILQAQAEQITTERGDPAAGHYQQHHEAFVTGQAELNASAVGRSPEEAQALHTEHDARKHDYAGFLAGRLSEFHERGGNAERAEDFATVRATHDHQAAELRGHGPTPETPAHEPTPDDDPNKPKGRGPAPDFAESAFVLLERGATGGQADTMSAHLFIDREQANEAARGFAMSHEDALRQGQTTWAEVHPVTPTFAANFADMEQAGRLESMAALYSTAREIDGAFMPADPREPGAIKGQFQEAPRVEIDNSPERPEHMRLTAAIEPAPGGSTSTRSTYFDPNQNRDDPNFDAKRGFVVAPQAEPANDWEVIRAEAKAAQPSAPGAERGPNHYAALEAITAQAEPENAWDAIRAEAKGEAPSERQPPRSAELETNAARATDASADLAQIAASRDVPGEAPSERVILLRQAEESAQRHAVEFAASRGEDLPEGSQANAWEAIRAEAKAEVTTNAAREGQSQEQDTGQQGPDAAEGGSGRGGPSMA